MDAYQAADFVNVLYPSRLLISAVDFDAGRLDLVVIFRRVLASVAELIEVERLRGECRRSGDREQSDGAEVVVVPLDDVMVVLMDFVVVAVVLVVLIGFVVVAVVLVVELDFFDVVEGGSGQEQSTLSVVSDLTSLLDEFFR